MKLKFIRQKQYADRIRRYSIIIDGEKCEEIRSGEEKTINVSDKPHEVYLKIDWCTSNTIKIQDTGKTEIIFSCYNSFSGPKMFIPFLILFYVTFWRDRYLTLEEKQIDF